MKVWKVILWILFFPFIMMWYILKGLFWLTLGAIWLFFKEASKPSHRYRNTKYGYRRY